MTVTTARKKTLTAILRPSKRRFLPLLGASLLFVIAGLWMIPRGHVFVGWMSVVFFGLGALVFAAQFLPNSSFLKLDDQGFTVRAIYREHFFRWSQVRDCRPLNIGMNTMVGYDFAAEVERSRTVRLARTLSACDAALPNTYGMKPEALAQLMNSARARALEGDPSKLSYRDPSRSQE